VTRPCGVAASDPVLLVATIPLLVSFHFPFAFPKNDDIELNIRVSLSGLCAVVDIVYLPANI
jgi:hypothetical protein